jgi:hypothetical protein
MRHPTADAFDDKMPAVGNIGLETCFPHIHRQPGTISLDHCECFNLCNSLGSQTGYATRMSAKMRVGLVVKV